MQSFDFDKIYKNVPQEQKQELIRFRLMYPYKHHFVAGTHWNYLSSGQGEETLLLLPGGLRLAETTFKLITAFEDEYRVISPAYPPVPTVSQLLDGIAGILEAEHIHQVTVVGASFGGTIAQCFVRKYPGKVSSLILANTGVSPTPDEGRLLRRSLKILPLLPTAVLRWMAKQELLRILSYPSGVQEFWRAYLKELFAYYITKEDILSHFEEAFDMAQHWPFKDRDLLDWSGKILILESDSDIAVKLPEREALKALYPQAQVHTFHNAGHTPSVTHREEYLSVIKDFLREQKLVTGCSPIYQRSSPVE